MATKSEIREAKKRIAYRIKEIDLAQIGLAQPEFDWQPKAVLLKAFSDMKDNLSTLKTHIIGNDDYTLAIELKDLIKPFLERFSAELIDGEDDLSMAINQQIFELDSVLGDLQDWISEYEKQPHEPTPQPEAGKTASALPNQAKNFVKNDETKTILSAWYDFLKEECVIPQTITEHCFVSSMLDGDISGIYPISKKAKFKSVIAKIKKRFADSWFDEVCKSAGLRKSQMESWNVGEGTAKSVWEKKLKQIAVE